MSITWQAPGKRKDKEPEKIEKERESYIDEDDQFEKIDVDGLENLDEDDDKKYNDFEA